jgi:hypothetical protein
MQVRSFTKHALGACAVVAVLAGCGGSAGSAISAFSPSAAGAQRGVVPNAAGCQNGRSGQGTETPSTQFTVMGRYLGIRVGSKPVRRFFVKGMAYSPTLIGKGVSDPPACNSPLRNNNKAIWSRDLPLMRAMGVNAIRVFNVTPPPWDKDVGTIDEFLDAAWNNGQHPIYVLMTISFPGTALNNVYAARDIAGQYQRLAAKYALYPAVMGVSIGNEITGGENWTTKAWWDNFNLVAQGAKTGFASNNAKKLVMTADYDGLTPFKVNGREQIAQIYWGEKYNAKVDAWGDNLYRGRYFSNLLEQIQDTTTKPVLLTEYGATAAYHPSWSNTYEHPQNPDKNGTCIPDGGPLGPVNRSVAELPGPSHNPNMGGLVDLATNMTQLTYDSFKADGKLAGGFYFEWSDEWWKADSGNPAYRSEHVGNKEFVPWFPGCGEDAAWYGLNGIKPGSGEVDLLEPRPTLDAIKAVWAQEPQ